MKYLFLSNVRPLLPLLDFDIQNVNIDLHNDFECSSIGLEKTTLEIYFDKIGNGRFYNERNAAVVFSEIVESNFGILEQKGKIGNLKELINFGRGELTSLNKYYDDKGIKYFFIEFNDGELINIFCRETIAILW